MSDEMRPGLQGWFTDEWVEPRVEKDADDAHAAGKSRAKLMDASDLIWKGSWNSQIIDIRDRIHPCFVNKYEDRKTTPVEVVATHTSKSTELPVYYIRGDNGIEAWMRGNYYNWQVSVRSPVVIPDVFFRLFDKEDSHEQLRSYLMEGFKEEWIFGPYSQNPQEFSVTLSYDPGVLFTFCFLVTEAVRREVEA